LVIYLAKVRGRSTAPPAIIEQVSSAMSGREAEIALVGVAGGARR
jgi:hypothetical protein